MFLTNPSDLVGNPSDSMALFALHKSLAKLIDYCCSSGINAVIEKAMKSYICNNAGPWQSLPSTINLQNNWNRKKKTFVAKYRKFRIILAFLLSLFPCLVMRFWNDSSAFAKRPLVFVVWLLIKQSKADSLKYMMPGHPGRVHLHFNLGFIWP